MSGIRLFFDFEHNQWKLETPVLLRPLDLMRVTQFTESFYKKRISGEIGPRRRRMQESLSILKPNNIQQILTGPGEKTLWFSGKY